MYSVRGITSSRVPEMRPGTADVRMGRQHGLYAFDDFKNDTFRRCRIMLRDIGM